MKILSQEIENVLKAKDIFGRCLAKRFMRLKHGLCLRLFAGIERVVFGGLFERFTVRCTAAIAVDIKYLIQSEPGKKLLTAIAAMNNVKVAAPEFL